MAKTKIQEGCVLTVTAPEAVTAGEIVAIGSLVGVALKAAAIGDAVEIDTEGVWDVKKATGVQISVGDLLYLIPASDAVNKTAEDQAFVGVAVAAAATAATTVRVKLNVGTPVVNAVA